MKKLIHLTLFFLLTVQLYGQDNLNYQKPPKEILELVDIERAPSLLMDSKKEIMIFLYHDTYKSLADLSAPEIKLAGLRINPKTNISSTISYLNNIKYKTISEKDIKQVKGLPKNPKLANFSWSPDEKKIAFTNTTDTGVELWYFDIQTGIASCLTKANLNASLGYPYIWFRNNNYLLVKTLPEQKSELISADEAIPKGPIITINEEGKKAQNMTFQDLLSNETDEKNFETLINSELHKVDLTGNITLWKEKDMYASQTFSPDGKYIMINTIHKPYSYQVPYFKFPIATTIYDNEGNLINNFNDKPLTESTPKGFMSTYTGKRNISWRNDKPATLYWVEALDEGDAQKEVDFRDEVFESEYPFTEKPKSLIKTTNRFSRIIWGNNNIAIAYDRWWNTRNTKAYVFNPTNNKQQPVILFDYNMQDVYNNPGSFNTTRNEYGRYVLDLNGNNAYLIGDGYTEKGQFPFVDEINLINKKTTRLYQSKYTDKMLDIISIMDAKQGKYLVNIEAPTEYPNYYILTTKKKNKLQQITFFENPFKSIANIHKEVIKYKRPDGVELNGTLYLPVGYDFKKKEKLPMIIWAYPTEYKDKSSAGQNKTNPNEFIYPHYGSPIYWVTQGYAILDGAAFPIIGEDKAEPNDTFIEQLVANAKAAIDAIDSLGYIDRNRIAVGGHSYGAFMTANLLTHSNLFAAGIARSGAYNRTLTPFGFQNEERNYWEAPKVYNDMSPFQNADKMKFPLLLIHGANDNNPGTYTMQSERYFNALKANGAPTRLVLLPKESHGYAAKESILHLLWEQNEWLENYVKNKE